VLNCLLALCRRLLYCFTAIGPDELRRAIPGLTPEFALAAEPIINLDVTRKRHGRPCIGDRYGEKMKAKANAATGRRILVVEDEVMIRMLLDGMLADLGYTMTAEAGAIDEAVALAKQADFDAAILDVNLNGQPITPVVEILIQRGLPFVFATGYGQSGVPEAYRKNPTLQKPFQAEALEQALKAIAPKTVA
jgi:CheY-like chemotaxis protein